MQWSVEDLGQGEVAGNASVCSWMRAYGRAESPWGAEAETDVIGLCAYCRSPSSLRREG